MMSCTQTLVNHIGSQYRSEVALHFNLPAIKKADSLLKFMKAS
jgi:hypothetical protein